MKDQMKNEARDKQAISEWFQNGNWKKGLSIIAHESTNQEEFYRQYHVDSKWWDAAFAYLQKTNLEALEPGNYPIEGDHVYAMVSEGEPKPAEETPWEGHHEFNDIQYIISGKAKMGVAPASDPATKETKPYDSGADYALFSVGRSAYYDATPVSFFIFTPQDIHQPAIRTEGSGHVKKIVIKVRMPRP